MGNVARGHEPRKPQIRSGAATIFDITAVTDDLASIAEWKENLQARIGQAELTFMYADCNQDISQLQAEAETFAGVCRAIGWRP